MTYSELLAQLEPVIHGLDDLPETTLDTEALLRLNLANGLASALQILCALAADETAGKFYEPGSENEVINQKGDTE